MDRQSSKTRTNNTVSSKQDESSVHERSKNILVTQEINTSHYNTNGNNAIDFMKYNTKRSLNIDGNKKSFYTNTDPGSPNQKQAESRNNLEIVNEKLKNWLVTLGFMDTIHYDFTGDQLPFFKDG